VIYTGAILPRKVSLATRSHLPGRYSAQRNSTTSAIADHSASGPIMHRVHHIVVSLSISSTAAGRHTTNAHTPKAYAMLVHDVRQVGVLALLAESVSTDTQ